MSSLTTEENIRLAEQEFLNFKNSIQQNSQNNGFYQNFQSDSHQLSYYISKVDELERVIEEKNTQIDYLNGSLKSLSQKVEEQQLQPTLDHSRNDAHLHKQNEEKSKMISILLIEKTELQGKVTSLEEIANKRLSEIEHLLRENSRITSEYTVLKDAFENNLVHNKTLTENFEQIKERYNDIQNRFNSEFQHRVEIEKTLERYKALTEKLNSDKENYERILSESPQPSFSSETMEMDANLKTSLYSISNELETIKKSSSAKEEELNKEIQLLRDRVQEETRRFTDLTFKHDAILVEINRLSNDYQLSQEMNNKLTLQLEESVHRPSSVEMDVQCSLLEDERKNLLSKVNMLENDNANLKKELDDVNHCMEKAKKQIHELKEITNGHKELMSQLDDQRATITIALKQNAELKEEKIIRDGQIEELTSRLEILKSVPQQDVSSSQNSASLLHRLEELKAINESLIFKLSEMEKKNPDELIENKNTECTSNITSDFEENVTVTSIPSQITEVTNHSIDLKKSHELLEKKFIALMDRLANVSEAKEHLEYLCTHLEMEANTVVDYITLYTHTRNEATKRAKHRENILRELIQERDVVIDLLIKLLDADNSKDQYHDLISRCLESLLEQKRKLSFFEFDEDQAFDEKFIPPLNYNSETHHRDIATSFSDSILGDGKILNV